MFMHSTTWNHSSPKEKWNFQDNWRRNELWTSWLYLTQKCINAKVHIILSLRRNAAASRYISKESCRNWLSLFSRYPTWWNMSRILWIQHKDMPRTRSFHSTPDNSWISATNWIDQPPADPSTIVMVMMKAKQISEASGHGYTVITFDQQLYRVAVNILGADH